MATKKLQTKRTVAISDIVKRHPDGIYCDTDKQYADLANKIYDIVHDDWTFMEDHEIKNACISIALYFEDIHSDTRQFETFTRLYKKMFGRYVPFYDSMDADGEYGGLDALRFVIWHSISAERNGRSINPTNDGLKSFAGQLFLMWEEEKAHIDSNEDLADYLFSEETQRDANHVKNVLIWIQRRSFLGRWYVNDIADKERELRGLFSRADADDLKYENECIAAFDMQAWPLSMKPQHIYAEMIRTDMDDPDDEVAETIDQMKAVPLGMFEIKHASKNHLTLKDFHGETINVRADGFSANISKMAKDSTHILGSFYNLGGDWQCNGLTLWSSPAKDLTEKFNEEARQHYSYMHDYVGQYDSFINSRGGERLAFVKNAQGYKDWMKQHLDIDISMRMPLDKETQNLPLALFFEPNGQITVCAEARCIKHPDNPYYDQHYAEEKSLIFVFESHYASPDLLLYLIEHGLLPDAKFNDIRGKQHGQLLMQENLEFMSRCMRRDIKSITSVHRRGDALFNDEKPMSAENYEKKLSFEEFVKMVAGEKEIRSSANKEWRVVRCNMTTTVIRDVSNRKDFNIPSRDIFNAYMALQPVDIQIANVVPYVGKENASAVSALLYNVAGRGRWMNNLRKNFDPILKNIMKKL